MNYFSIAQLAQFSGIKAHTIRIWEQRYHALKPARSEGNTRFYSDLDLKRLLNIVSLTDQYRVSELCSMSDKALNNQVGKLYLEKSEKNSNPFVSQLIAAGMEFNESSFQKVFSHCLLRFGVSDTYKDIIYPLLNRLGLMWASDHLPAAHEHFISNMIRQKLLTAIDSLPLSEDHGKKWVLFLPEDEYHEMGLLFAQYVLGLQRQKVFYLGASVPLSTLSLACKNIKPDSLLLFFVHNDLPENINLYLSALTKNFKQSKIYISGHEKLMERVDVGKKITWLRRVEDLEAVITNV